MTLPVGCGLLATMGAQLVVTAFVGSLGVAPLAAISFTFPVVMIAVNIGVGLAAGTSSVVARDLGSNRFEDAARLCTDALLLSAGVSIVLAMVGLVTIGPLFRAMGASAGLMLSISQYMSVWYLGVPPFIAAIVAMSILRAAGDATFQGLSSMATAILSVALTPPLMSGVMGWHGWGLAGAAVANNVASVVLLGLALGQMHRRVLVAWFWPSWGEIRDSARRILRIALPAAATNTVIPVAAAIITALLAQFGALAVAGFGVATRVEAFAMIVFYALSAVMNPFVGQNFGAGQLDRVRSANARIAMVCVAWGGALAVVLFFLGHQIALLVTRDEAVAQIAASYFRIVPVSYAAAGIIMNVNAAFNGLNQPGAAVVVSIARVILVNVPVAYIGGRLFGAAGVFSGICVANVSVGIVALVWLRAKVVRLQGDGGKEFRLQGRVG
jgi:putative MATE family efflux protein